MNKIYTKTGDNGQTSLLTGERVYKDCLVLKVVGELDELNAVLGLALSVNKKNNFNLLSVIQKDLFKVGSELAAAQLKNKRAVKMGEEKNNLIGDLEIENLEKQIDEMWQKLPELKSFILPSGNEVASFIHLARTVCRRAERELISLEKEREVRMEVGKYLNRLSDYLFCLARFVNFENGVEETVV